MTATKPPAPEKHPIDWAKVITPEAQAYARKSETREFIKGPAVLGEWIEQRSSNLLPRSGGRE